MKKIYLDYAATTPVDKQVIKAMAPFLAEKFGNDSSLHSFGREAKKALEESRKTLAKSINADSNEIIFTGSATESNNFALKGLAFAHKSKNHIIISAIEHDCVLESAHWLQTQGFEITKVAVDEHGLINPEDVKSAITDKTLLVSVIFASNEIGTIQPIQEIADICKSKNVYFHTDASQAFGKIPIDVKKMNIDLLSASSHKIYGPKGAALLYIRKGIKIEPLLHGGGQEHGLRSSTVNVGAIVGFAKAMEICGKEMHKEQKRLEGLRDLLIKEVLNIEASHLNGHPEKRLSNNVNVWFAGVDGESLIIHLDLKGFACSVGSACSSIALEPSHVLTAIGLTAEQANGSLRISLGRQTTEKEIKDFVKTLAKIIKQMRGI